MGHVFYPWHPWSGRAVVIESEERGPSERTVVCRLEGEPDPRGRRLPAWMLELHWQGVTLDPLPCVAFEALAELRALLDRLLYSFADSPPPEGDRDEGTEQERP